MFGKNKNKQKEIKKNEIEKQLKIVEKKEETNIIGKIDSIKIKGIERQKIE